MRGVSGDLDRPGVPSRSPGVGRATGGSAPGFGEKSPDLVGDLAEGERTLKKLGPAARPPTLILCLRGPTDRKDRAHVPHAEA